MLQSLFKEIAIYGFADFLFRLMSFATFPLFAFALTIEEFGLFTLIVTLSNLMGICFSCGLNNAVQRYYFDLTTEIDERPKIVYNGLLTLITNGLICLGAVFFGIVYDHISLFSTRITSEMLFFGFLSSLCMQINTFCMDVTRANFQPWNFTLLSFIQNAFLVFFPLFFVFYYKLGIIGYLLGTALAYLATTPCCLWMIKGHLLLKIDFKLIRKLVTYGYPFIFTGIAYWLFGSMDRWMLEVQSSEEQVGLYSIAFKMGSILIFLNTAFSQAWSPRALKAFREEPTYRTSFSQFFTIWLFVLLTLTSILNLFSQEFLILLTPKTYWPATLLMPFIGMSLAFFGTNQIIAMGIALENKTSHFSIASWLAAAVNFLFNWLLIPKYGAQGAAFATFCSTLFLWSYYLICCQRLHPIPLEKSKLAICLCLAIISIAFTLQINAWPWSYAQFLAKICFISIFSAIGFKLNILNLAAIQKVFVKS